MKSRDNEHARCVMFEIKILSCKGVKGEYKGEYVNE